MSDLTEYERQRLEHIRRNHEMLVRLGLVNVKPDRATEPTKGPPAQRRKTVKEIAPETLRRSARVRGATPDYTKEVIDTFGDELERRCEPGAKRKRGRVFADEPSDDDADSGDLVRGEILESTTAFLREAREALLQFVSSESGEAPVDARGWRAEAVRRWGDLAGGGQTAERDWEQYVRSRMSTPPPPSPHDLLQEYYAHDVWQLLCVCVLMSRVSSWDTKHRCARSRATAAERSCSSRAARTHVRSLAAPVPACVGPPARPGASPHFSARTPRRPTSSSALSTAVRPWPCASASTRSVSLTTASSR